MRKLVIIAVAVLVPVGLWTAGCRQNRQAAFPATPEMKSIARAPEQTHPTRPPAIPAAIDREILATPDQPTFARIRAVMDRSEILANRDAGSGLFVLPEMDSDAYQMSVPETVMATYQEPQPAVYSLPEPVLAMAPEPVPYQPSTTASVPVPSGAEFWSRPVKTLPARSYHEPAVPNDIYAMMPAAPVAAEPAPEAVSLPPAFMTDVIPGVFMGTDGETDATGWIGFQSRHESGAGPEPFEIDKFSRDQAYGWRPDGQYAGDLDLVALLSPLKTASPPVSSEKLVELFENTDIRQALEPLPDISDLLLPLPDNDAFSSSRAAPESAMPAMADIMPPPPAESKQDGGLNERDLYRMDIPAAKTTDTPSGFPMALPELPDLKNAEPVGAVNPSTFNVEKSPAAEEVMRRIMQTSARMKAVQGPTGEPVRPPAMKTAGNLQHIDSSVEVPPLKF